MASIWTVEDYYAILQVERNATVKTISSAYRRLAFELHPDRNKQSNATESFQRLGQAYEILKDAQTRREYDLLHPYLERSRAPTSTPASQSEVPVETEQISAIQKAKQDRLAKWQAEKKVLESTAFEMERVIRRLEQAIRLLIDIAAAEAAAEAQKNSWTAWFVPSSYGRKKDSDEDKARKDRNRQERRLELDMKERRLDSYRTDLKKAQSQLDMTKRRFDDANTADDIKIGELQTRYWQKQNSKRQEQARAEEARKQALWREEQERARAAAEATRKARADTYAAQQQRQKEEEATRQQDNARRSWRENFHTRTEYPSQSTPQSACCHEGWWLKVQCRTACPQCNDVWTYLLQCPSCNVMACPKCQASLRPRRARR